MTRIAASIFVDSVQGMLALATAAARQGADLVELRIDALAAAGPACVPQLHDLLARCPLPVILTCRPTWEGGRYDGDEDQRLAVLQAACLGPRPPAMLDLELAAWQRSANLRQKIQQVVDHPGQVHRAPTQLILSSHDFHVRPADLAARVEAMTNAPACRIVKLAWRAADLTDNIAAFELLTSRHKPTVALCMGPAGLMSRVLARKYGAPFTFAAVDEDAGTAPGQPGISQLRQLYRWDKLGPQTCVLGVIGHPVAHSMSPPIHNAGFDAAGFDGVYLPLPVEPGYEAFAAALDALLGRADLLFRGASVTIPHKENLLRYVHQRHDRRDHIEPLAQRIGAANTLVVNPDGSLAVCNTDYAAALDAVCQGLGIERDELAGQGVGVIGAGGAARAIVAGFAQHGARITIYNRTVERAARLAGEFDGHTGPVAAAPLEQLADATCQVFINCTPIGMHPAVDASPLADTRRAPAWGPGTVVFDTIYNPPQTRMLRQARAAGCLTISGLEMFVRQAVGQFERWTGLPAPVDLFRKVAIQQLAPV